RTEQAEHGLRLNLQVDAVDGLDVAEVLRQTFDADGRLVHLHLRTRQHIGGVISCLTRSQGRFPFFRRRARLLRSDLGVRGCRKGGIAMLLESKTAVIYGAGGRIGGGVARTFAREGATVYLEIGR